MTTLQTTPETTPETTLPIWAAGEPPLDREALSAVRAGANGGAALLRAALALGLGLLCGLVAGCGDPRGKDRTGASANAGAGATAAGASNRPATGVGAPTPGASGALAPAGSTAAVGTGSTAPVGTAATAPVGTAAGSAGGPPATPGGVSAPPGRALPAPTRPITVGPGPVVGQTTRGQVFEHLRDWAAADLRALDPIDAALSGDGLRDSRELVAFYSRREAGRLALRVDLLDLRYGAELGGLDLVVLLGWPGAAGTTPPLRLRERTRHPFGAAVVVEDAATAAVLDHALAPVAALGVTTAAGRPALEVSFRSDLDAVELALDEAVLRGLGWTGQPLTFQVLSVQDGAGRVADAVLERDLADRALDEVVHEGWVADRRGVLAPVVVGNRAALPASALTDLVGSRRTTTSEGLPTGLHRALESHQAHGLPVTVHLTGALAAAIGWARSADPLSDGPALLRRLAAFWDGDPANGEGAYLPGLYADHVMPYLLGAANRAAYARGMDAARALLGVPAPGPVFWAPERVVSGDVLDEVLALGFTHTVVDATHLARWAGLPHDAADGKLHRLRGVSCFVIDPRAGLFAHTDGGPSLALRTLLLERALNPDGQRVVVAAADWEEFAGHKGNPDVPDAWDRTLAWLSQRPWIEVATLADLAGRGWTAVDHGSPASLPVEAHEWLRHANEESYDHWYHGHPLEESFAAMRPNVRPGVPFPRVLGEVGRAGTLLGDAWAAIEAAPAGPLRALAERSFFHALYRTAWHQEDMHDLTRLASGAYLAPDATWDPLSGFVVALSSRIGETAVIARAARWATNPPAAPGVAAEDVDLDGEDEWLLWDERALLVVERTGGRVVAGFGRDPSTGRAAQVFGAPIAYPEAGRDAGVEGTATDAPRTSVLKDVWATGPGRDYVNDQGVAAVATHTAGPGVVVTSSDGAVRKTIWRAGPGRFEVRYDLDPALGTMWVRLGLAPDVGALHDHGQAILREREQGGVYTLEAVTPATGGGSGGAPATTTRVSVGWGDAGHGARRNAQASDGTTASPRNTAFQHMIELSGDAPGFGLSLEVELR